MTQLSRLQSVGAADPMTATATLESKSLLKRIDPLDDRLREMTRFGERQLSLERSQLLKIFAF